MDSQPAGIPLAAVGIPSVGYIKFRGIAHAETDGQFAHGAVISNPVARIRIRKPHAAAPPPLSPGTVAPVSTIGPQATYLKTTSPKQLLRMQSPTRKRWAPRPGSANPGTTKKSHAGAGGEPAVVRCRRKKAAPKGGFNNLATTYSRRTLRPTTIGAVVFHGRVRDGNGWDHHAKVTRSRLGMNQTGRDDLRGEAGGCDGRGR